MMKGSGVDLQVLKQIAKKSLRNNRVKNNLIVTTIAISIALIILIGVLSIQQGIDVKEEYSKLYQATFSDVSEETISKVSQMEHVNRTGVVEFVDELLLGENSFFVEYIDSGYFNFLINGYSFEGSYPEKRNEIIVSKDFTEYINQKITVGSEVELDLGCGIQTFKVSGIIENLNNVESQNIIYISKLFLDEISEEESKTFDMFLWIKDVNKMSTDKVRELIYDVADNSGVEEDNVNLNMYFFQAGGYDLSGTDILELILLAVFILLAAAIVVYSIFYISVAGKIREYGRYHTIGMTEKQIKKLVEIEARYMMFRGIGIGVVGGTILAYCIRKGNLSLALVVSVVAFVMVFGYILIGISVKKPALMAASMAPAEAIKYVEYKGIGKERKKRKKITVLRLAYLNLVRNPKKTILSLVSIVLCGSIFIAIASIQHSFSAENMVRNTYFPNGSYKIYFEGDYSVLEQYAPEAAVFGGAVLQQRENILEQNFIEKVKELDAVENIIEYKGTTVAYSVQDAEVMDQQTVVWGYSKSQQKKLDNLITEGTADYESLCKNKGILINGKSFVNEIFNWDVEIGDMVEIKFWRADGNVMSEYFTVMGILEGSDGFSQYIRMPEELLEQQASYNCNKYIEIVTTNGENEELTVSLEQLIGDSDLTLERFSDSVKALNSTYESAFMLIYILVIFLGTFSFISILNMVMTNLVGRKREIALFEAIGMTENFLNKSLMMEGIGMSLVAIMFSLVFGTLLGRIGCNLLDAVEVSISYKFPVSAVTLFSLIVILAISAITFVMSNSMNRINLIERLKNE